MEQPNRVWRLGVVSFLNSRPLIAGLEVSGRVDLVFDVPARLPALLDAGSVDAALVPVVDLVSAERNWRILSDACIGCDGETLTVRVFSRIPPEDITRLHVDGDSHTSVMLARILWQEAYGRTLELVPYTGVESQDDCEAILLIGDKVVTDAPTTYEIQTDLGSLWKSLTGLPFVFAVWAVRDPGPVNLDELARILCAARDAGVASAEMIAEDFAPGRGWPETLARRYLTTRLKFHLGDKQRQGMARFLTLAKQYDMVPIDQELVFA